MVDPGHRAVGAGTSVAELAGPGGFARGRVIDPEQFGAVGSDGRTEVLFVPEGAAVGGRGHQFGSAGRCGGGLRYVQADGGHVRTLIARLRFVQHDPRVARGPQRHRFAPVPSARGEPEPAEQCLDVGAVLGLDLDEVEGRGRLRIGERGHL